MTKKKATKRKKGKKPPEEGAGARRREGEEDERTPMERMADFTRRIVNVPKEETREEDGRPLRPQ